MALTPGTRLGPYEVVALIGEGGMGQVWRARDTQLDRAVALKILPEAFTSDPDRLARFQREAKILASLNHPHIAHIHGLEQTPSIGSALAMQALVMELVEGEDLAYRIARGPIPLDEALPITKQIAEALEAAHEQGIIHRDLKPANIKVRPDGTVKVLDFGLAKALEPRAQSLEPAVTAPTITSPVGTIPGVILGTAAYMSPEQARGKPVDKRTDIWAFGAVLFEMLTARRAFPGDDLTEMLAAVVKSEPDWTVLPAATPPAVRRLLRRCLAKDPRRRLSDIAAVRLDLDDGLAELTEPVDDWQGEGSRRPRPAWWQRPLPLVGVGATLVAGTALVMSSLPGPPASTSADQASAIRFQVWPPEGAVFPGAGDVPRFAVSPDGTRIAFAVSHPGDRDQLYIRRLDAFEATPVQGTESPTVGGGANQQPFWSPDGRYVAYFDGVAGALKRVPADGGLVETLAELEVYNAAGSWHGDVILAGTGSSAVLRVPATGGVPAPVTVLDEDRGEVAHLFPAFLPDGRHFLYLARSRDGPSTICVGSLDGTPGARLVRSPYMGAFAPPDQVLYVRGQSLVAQTMDLSTFRLVGEPRVVATSVMAASLNGRVGVSASSNGVLVVARRAEGVGGEQASWRDRNGQPIDSAPTEAVDYPAVRISPDGRMIAFVGASASRDIWVRDLAGRVGMRVTTDNSVEMNPVWSPDSTRVAFASRDAELRWEIYERAVSGLTPARKLVGADGVGRLVPHEWSTDGRFLVYSRTAAGPDTGLWILPLGEPGAPPRRYLTDAFVGQAAALSTDGHWLAYVSNESGRAEVFVRTFPDSERGKKQVSAEGGSFPRWRRDGRELFYLDARNRVVAVDIQADGDLDVGRVTPLFEAGPVAGGDPARAPLDVTADGQRFLIVTPAATSNAVSLDVSVNWTRDVTREP